MPVFSDGNLYVLADVTAPMPLLVLLHGARNNGASQLAVWRPIADKEKVILLAPNSVGHDRWWDPDLDEQNVKLEIQQALESLNVNRRRIYVAGHSLGAALALR